MFPVPCCLLLPRPLCQSVCLSVSLFTFSCSARLSVFLITPSLSLLTLSDQTMTRTTRTPHNKQSVHSCEHVPFKLHSPACVQALESCIRVSADAPE